MEIVIVCLVACVICVAAVLVTNHTATQKGYTKGVQDGIQQRKQQAEAEIGSAEKEAARVIHDAKKEAEQQKKSVLQETHKTQPVERQAKLPAGYRISRLRCLPAR